MRKGDEDGREKIHVCVTQHMSAFSLLLTFPLVISRRNVQMESAIACLHVCVCACVSVCVCFKTGNSVVQLPGNTVPVT